MNIKIIDSGKKEVTQEKIDTYENAVICFLNYWGITGNINLNLYLDFPKNCFRDPKSTFYKQDFLKNALGVTSYSDDEFDIFLNRSFLYEKYKEDDYLFVNYLMDSLAHEIVHVKQYYYKELEVINNTFFYEGIDLSDFSYEEYPHEIEAYLFSPEMRIAYAEEQLYLLDFLQS